MKKHKLLLFSLLLGCSVTMTPGSALARSHNHKKATSSKAAKLLKDGKGRAYLVNKSGKKFTGKVCIKKWKDAQYCLNKKGYIRTGWITLKVKGKRQLYFAQKDGRLLTSATYGGISFGPDGRARTTYRSLLKIWMLNNLPKITAKKATREEKLRACWSYIVGKKFRYSTVRSNYGMDWPYRYAYHFLVQKKGDCVSYACAFGAMAAELGFESVVEDGYAGPPSVGKHTSRARAHCWNVINGKYYDPERFSRKWLPGSGYAMDSYDVIQAVYRRVSFNS